MDDLDDGFFGPEFKGFIAFLALALVVFAAFTLKPLPNPRPDITGCYSADGAPDIAVDRNKLTVWQQPALQRSYKLEYHKGWVIAIQPGFDWVIDQQGQLRVRDGFPHGEFIPVAERLDRSPGIFFFDLVSPTRMSAIGYQLTSRRCGTGGHVVAP